MSQASISKIKQYLENGLNILIIGESGTGKTSMAIKACEELGYKTAYFHAPTVDPFIHLIGIPAPDKETNSTVVYPPKNLDDVDVIIIDEINRANSDLENSCFELLQFKSVNQRKFKNLKAIISSINPVSDEYNVKELDFALTDRFDVTLHTNPILNKEYLRTKFDENIVESLNIFYTQYMKEHAKASRAERNKDKGYISPRKVEKIAEQFLHFKRKEVISEMLPVNAQSATQPLYDALKSFNKKNIHELQRGKEIKFYLNHPDLILSSIESIQSIISSTHTSNKDLKELYQVIIMELSKLPFNVLLKDTQFIKILSKENISELLKNKSDREKNLFYEHYMNILR